MLMVMSMKESTKLVKYKVREGTHVQMAMSMKENGNMVVFMARESSLM